MSYVIKCEECRYNMEFSTIDFVTDEEITLVCICGELIDVNIKDL